MAILGISAFYHDAAAAIIHDGKIMVAAQEERFTRIKNDASFPENAIRFCLESTSLSLNELEAIAFYDKPFLKFERLLETYLEYAPKGLSSFLISMPIWVKQKLFIKQEIYKALNQIEKFDRKVVPLLFPEHHLSHAASTFFVAPFSDSAILTIDGVGEWATTTISYGTGNKITTLKELHFPHSVGLLYSAFAYYCGFKVNSGEYKLMGLAPFGNLKAHRTKEFIAKIKSSLCTVYNDGSIRLNMKYFAFPYGLKMINSKNWERLFGFPARIPESNIEPYYCDLALAIQTVIEEIIIKLAKEAKRLTGASTLCMAGGVALNCVANGKLQDEQIFDDIFIQPAAGDAGGSLGAALAVNYLYFDKERCRVADSDSMNGSLLGPAYSEDEVVKTLKKNKASYKKYLNEEELLDDVAQLLEQGNVIGWHQGRSEFGPRALGARSIIADARNPSMQEKLNLKIKFRESFRPFAPMVLAEDAKKYFDINKPSPYMLFVRPIQKNRQINVPDNTENIYEKLKFIRSDVPAVTHVDYTARVQTVHHEITPKLWKLLLAFKSRTGCSVLVNTSFNVRGEPIVNTPEEAYHCFIKTDMDCLVIGNILLRK